MKFYFCFVLFFISNLALSQDLSLSGKVLEKGTSEPLIGAAILIVESNQYALAGLDGSYAITNLKPGTYTLKVMYIGFKDIEQTISLSENTKLTLMAEPDVHQLGDVVVMGVKDESSEESARMTEKNVMNVLNVISSKEIDASPDITVANVIQRVSGVSLERNNNGDGQHAIVRGMDKRYNYTLVNGIKIPSPDPRNRYVPLDIFPSDLLDRLEVTKALTPNMEGDAIGGVIDMKMKNAPDRFTFSINLGTGYNGMFFDKKFKSFDRQNTSMFSPRVANGNDYRATVSDFPLSNIDFQEGTPNPNQIYSISIGDRFLKNKLGVLVAGSYQNTFRGADSKFMQIFINQNDNTPYYERVQVRQFSVQQIRTGVHSKIDYRFNQRNKLSLYSAFVRLNDFETRSRVDTILAIGRGQGPGTGRIEIRERSRQTYQTIYNATLQGNHEINSRVVADWSAVYSLATNNDPDMSQITWVTAITRNAEGNTVQDPIMYDTDYSRRWMNSTDNDLAAYGNLKYKSSFRDQPLELSGGGMVRFKSRESFFDSYLLRTSPLMQEWSGNIYDGTWNLFNPAGQPTAPLNYEVDENVVAGYGMFKYDLNKLNILGGLRYEATDFSWESRAPVQVDGRTGSIVYSDLLPSLHFKFMPDNNKNFRLSYFSSISRPSFFEVIPYEINEEDFRERGNPNLRRTKAENFDFRYENFSSVLDKIMVGVFYKQINDPIERALAIEGQLVFLQSSNFGDATNMGMEFDFTRYVRNFGVRFFYTFTNSQITTDKLFRFRDEEGNLSTRIETQTRPLQGQSAHISNLSLLYKSLETGSDVQLSTVYTGRRIIGVSPFLDNDLWQRAFIQLDLSIEQRVRPGIILYFKVNNILDSPLRADILQPNTFNPEQVTYWDSSENTPAWEDFYNRTFFLGAKINIHELKNNRLKF